MAGHSGGPWGGGGNNGSGGGDDDRGDEGRRPPQRPNNGGPQIPELDDLLRQGRERFRAIVGGGGGGGGPSGPLITRGGIFFGLVALLFLWAFMSFYRVEQQERSVELFLGECIDPCVGEPGLNFAAWPLVTHEVIATTEQRSITIGDGASGGDAGLMLTGDENIVDIDFQVVWNIVEPDKYLFNLADPEVTIAAVSESAMREIIAQSELAPILNRDRDAIATRLEALIQDTLDGYDAGVNIVTVNFDKADPPGPVIAAFRDVQNAEQERVQLQNQADAYNNRIVAQARGDAARLLEEAESYRAQVVNEAEGEASRFLAVLAEYQKAPEVTRRRLYLETMEEVLGRVDVIILDDTGGGAGGQGVIPYLPLNDLRRNNGGAN